VREVDEQRLNKKEAPAATEAFNELVDKLIVRADQLSQKPMTISEYKLFVEAVAALQPLAKTTTTKNQPFGDSDQGYLVKKSGSMNGNSENY
jgi:hypothetical protein